MQLVGRMNSRRLRHFRRSSGRGAAARAAGSVRDRRCGAAGRRALACAILSGVVLAGLSALSAQPQDAPGATRDSSESSGVQDRDSEDASQKPDVFGIAAAVAERFKALEYSITYDTATERGVIILWGNARGLYTTPDGRTFSISADRIALLGERGPAQETDRTERRRRERDGASGEPSPPQQPDERPAAGSAEGGPGEGATEAAGATRASTIRSASLYAEGNVRIETADLVLEADAFFYDHEKRRGVAVEARGRGVARAIDELPKVFASFDLHARSFLDSRRDTAVGPTIGAVPSSRPPVVPAEAALDDDDAPRDPSDVQRADPLRGFGDRRAEQIAFRAEVLRVLDLDHYEGEGLIVSSCEFGKPHFGIAARSMRVTRRPRQRAERARDRATAGEAPTPDGSSPDTTPGDTPSRQGSAPEGAAPEAAPATGSGGLPTADEGEERDAFDLDPEGAWLAVGGVPVVPFPVGEWNTEWHTYVPIRDLVLSQSSKFGTRAGVDWNIDWLLRKVPGTGVEPVRDVVRSARIDGRTEYLSKRGFGYGVDGTYGRSPEKWTPWELDPDAWHYYGESVYYRIDDHGKDRTGPASADDFNDERWWGRLIHRQSIPMLGILDVEYSEQSDDNFLNEFFPSTRDEKEQESLVYLRRSFTDTTVATALAKYRTNDFETTTERIPEAKFFVLEQPVVEEHLYTSLSVQAARLRNRPSDDIDVPRSADDPTDDIEARTRDYGRFDAENEWGVPFGFGQYLRLRPFASARFSAYETGLHPEDHSIDRRSFGAGVTASQQWSRVFRMPGDGWVRRWLDITALKHDVIPKVTYANVFETSVAPERLFQVDEVDAVDDLEVIDLSLRNVIWARGRGPRVTARREPRPRADAAAVEGDDSPAARAAKLEPLTLTTHALLDFESSLRWFMQPARDNSGDRFSELDLDLTLFPLRYLAVRSRNFLDPDHDLEFQLSDNSVTVDVVPGQLFFTVGERIRRDAGEFYYSRIGLRFSRKYFLEAYGGIDSDDRDRTDVELRLVRFFHRFAVEGSYSFDAGERDNHTFSVNVYPVELMQSGWEDRVRRYFR